MERIPVDSREPVRPDVRITPRELYRHGDSVRHAGDTWTVVDDRGKNIVLRNEKSYKTVLPSDVEALKQEMQ